MDKHLSLKSTSPFLQTSIGLHVHKVKMNTKSVLMVVWNLQPEIWQNEMCRFEGGERMLLCNNCNYQQQRAFPWPMLLVRPNPREKENNTQMEAPQT